MAAAPRTFKDAASAVGRALKAAVVGPDTPLPPPPARPETPTVPDAPLALGLFEREAICREAFEAYDFFDERVRFDTLGRRWLFRIDRDGPNSVLFLDLSRLDKSVSSMVPTPALASDLGKQLIAQAVDSMDEAVR